MTKPQIRILVIDDDIVDRKACQRVLAQNPDYEFVLSEAETGQEGLQLAHSEKPDCILLDYRLPDLDGLEFLAERRDEGGEIPIPVMMLTGADNALVAVEAMKRGARDYLVKDVERQYLELLPTMIERLLRERQLQGEKKAAEAKYRTLVEQVPAITYVSALDGKDSALYISPQIKALGFSPEEWLADPGIHLRQIYPDDRQRVEDQLAQSRVSGKPFSCEYRLRARSGAILWFRDQAIAVRDESGQPLVLQGILVDITQSKQMEEELRAHRHRLEELVAKRTQMLTRANEQLRQDIVERRRVEEALFEEKERAQVTLASIGDAVITTDAAGRIEYMNPVAEQITGWSGADAQNQPLEQVFRIVDEVTREPVASPAARCMAEDRRIGLTNHNVLIRRDGGELAVAESSAPIHDRKGKAVGAVIVFHDVSQQRKLAQQLSYQAAHDALTGLVNRREFERRLARVLASVNEDHSEHAVCYLDLDGFKAINDSCGHAAGDRMLRQISALLLEKMRQRDTLARLGGDEFGLLLEHCPLDQARGIAGELLQAVQNFRFQWEGRSYSVGASIGVAAISADGENLAAVLSAADAACYAAKQSGRNRISVYQPGDAELLERHSETQWAARITQALEKNGFQLFYQPITMLASDGKERAHYEILVRMLDQDGKLIPPGAFMPAAERHNLMPAIDRWVAGQVISRLAAGRLDRQEAEMPLYAINLSAASLADNTIVDFIREQLQAHQAPAHALCFEISETAAAANLAQAARVLRELKQLGCYITLDNFGGALSFVACLKNLPVDFLKLGSAFVKDIAKDQVAQTLVEAVNQLAHVMVIQTIAERAESDVVLEKLRQLGVDHAQGFAISSPRPLEELAPYGAGAEGAPRNAADGRSEFSTST